MRSKILIVCLVAVVLAVLAVWKAGCISRPAKAAAPVLARVNGYEILADEFEEGFMTSAFSARADKLEARREYLGTLVNQKLILLDAQKKDLDKDPDFLRSVERFWAQSLLTTAMGIKTLELHRGVRVQDEEIRGIYAGMVKDGVTDKPFDAVYPQIKWQAEKQLEARLLEQWVQGLRASAVVSVDENVLRGLK